MNASDSATDRIDDQCDNQSARTDCPECAGTVVTEGGEIRCADCGLIVAESRLTRQARPTYGDDKSDRERTGAPLTPARHDRGLSTEIGTITDGTGRTLPGKKRCQLARLRREHRRAQWDSTADRNLAYACSDIARLVASLGLPREIRKQASHLFRQAQSADLLPGRSVEAFAAGCVYAVCRCGDPIRTLDAVAARARCSRDEVANAYGVLNTDLGLPTPPPRPREFIPAHASALDLPAETERLGWRLAVRAAEAGLSTGTDPSGFAAACLTLAAERHDVDLRQLDAAAVADVSPATIRVHRNAMQDELYDESV